MAETTEKFHPTSGHSGVAADGYASRGVYNITWANLRGGAGTGGGDESGMESVRIGAWSTQDLWVNLYRTFWHFDTALLPLGLSIVSALVSVYIYEKVDGLGAVPSLALVESNDPTPGAITSADYQNLDIVPVAPVMTWAEIPAAGRLSFPIDEDYFNLIVPGGVTKFGIREYKYDILNTPPPWVKYKAFHFDILTLETAIPGGGPYLEITYLTGVPRSSGFVIG